MSSLTRAEIDLREKIAAEIEAAAVNGDGKWAMMRAIGVVRAPLNHNTICPCSLCDKWQIKSCSDDCNKHRKITNEEAQEFFNRLGVPNQAYTCGWCNNGHNEWKIEELLFDIENEFPLTPCCHTEATEALDLPEIEEDNQRKEDEESYRYSVLGR
jgi:predicted sulfurtransferase